jgi:hypothetical protein
VLPWCSTDPTKCDNTLDNQINQQAQNQAQNAAEWKKQIEGDIQFDKDARAAYQKFGPTAKSVKELEEKVKAELTKKYGAIGVAGTTDASGKVEVKPDPNKYRVEATNVHERVHQQTTLEGIAKYGAGTPAFKAWRNNPQNWAADEVKAYSADIKYMQDVLPTIK